MCFEGKDAISQYFSTPAIDSLLRNNRLLNGLPSKSEHLIHLLGYLG